MAGDFTQLYLYHKDDYDKILDGTAEPIKTLDIGEINSANHKILFGKESAEITISGERNILYKVKNGESITHEFEATSDYPDECKIRWDFGDNSKKIETDGNKSNISHEYKDNKLFKVKAELLDKDNKEIAEDSITIEIESSKEKSGATTYRGKIPFSKFNSDEGDGNFFKASDQDITLIKNPDDTWRLIFDYSATGREKWPPATDVTETFSFNVDADNINIFYHEKVDTSHTRSGIYQGNDVSWSEKGKMDVEVNFHEKENGNLNLSLIFDIYNFDIEMKKVSK